jgi:hypothetical protein
LGSRADKPLSHRTIKPSNCQATELESHRLSTGEPSSQRAVEPSIRQAINPPNRYAVKQSVANRQTIEPSGSHAADHRAIESLSRRAGEPSCLRPLNHQAI